MGLAAFNRLRRLQQEEAMKPENLQKEEIKEEPKPIEEPIEEVKEEIKKDEKPTRRKRN